MLKSRQKCVNGAQKTEKEKNQENRFYLFYENVIKERLFRNAQG